MIEGERCNGKTQNSNGSCVVACSDEWYLVGLPLMCSWKPAWAGGGGEVVLPVLLVPAVGTRERTAKLRESEEPGVGGPRG